MHGAVSYPHRRLTSGKRQMSEPSRKPRVVIHDDNNSNSNHDDEMMILHPFCNLSQDSMGAFFPEVPGDHLKTQYTELDHKPPLEPETTSRW